MHIPVFHKQGTSPAHQMCLSSWSKAKSCGGLGLGFAQAGVQVSSRGRCARWAGAHSLTECVLGCEGKDLGSESSILKYKGRHWSKVPMLSFPAQMNHKTPVLLPFSFPLEKRMIVCFLQVNFHMVTLVLIFPSKVSPPYLDQFPCFHISILIFLS